jgi:hypothetical protein
MVYNLKGEWIGMAIAKVSLSDNGYITSAQDIIDDIQKTTRGTISLS